MVPRLRICLSRSRMNIASVEKGMCEDFGEAYMSNTVFKEV